MKSLAGWQVLILGIWDRRTTSPTVLQSDFGGGVGGRHLAQRLAKSS